MKSSLLSLSLASLLALASHPTQAAPAPEPLRFDFGATETRPGWTTVGPDTLYSAERGHGLVLAPKGAAISGGGKGAAESDSLIASGPCVFAVRLPEGNYAVRVRLGDPKAAADTCVKAETRRLMLDTIRTAPGEIAERTFTVNIRTAALANGGRVALKPREKDTFHWDDTLLLEFNGTHPAVASVEIIANPAAHTVFLAGDSTVTDQPGEPWCAWGQMLPAFFDVQTAVSNHAESGLSLATFRNSRRLEKVLEMLKSGDHVLIQFGHNDQKEKGEGVGAFTTYADSLRDYVRAIRAKGGEPVLVTPMYRRRFNEQGLFDTLGDFPLAVRNVAAELEVPLIDLHSMSARVLTALGPDRSKAAFVHYKAGDYPGATTDVKDDTHFSTYGANELAKCIVEGIREKVPALAKRLRPGIPPYNPDQPADPSKFSLPLSLPVSDSRIPDGDGR